MITDSQARDLRAVLEVWSAAPRGLFTLRDRGMHGIDIIEVLPDRSPRLIATMNPGLGRESGMAIAWLFAKASPGIELMLNIVSPALTKHLPS